MNLRKVGGIGLAAVVIAMLAATSGCSGKKQEAASPAGGTETSAATETAKPEAVAAGAQIEKTGTGIVIKGSGNAVVGPVDLDKSCYIITAKYSYGEFSMMTFSWIDKFEGNDIDRNLGFVPSTLESGYVRVFGNDMKGQPSRAYTFKIEAEGSYEIEFKTPPALDTAAAAPQTFKGGFGYTVTPLVKNARNYIMLQVMYPGTADNSTRGIPLVTGDLYDAETGDSIVRNQSCFKAGVVSEDGFTARKPGIYFAVVNCSQKDGAWEVTIKE